MQRSKYVTIILAIAITIISGVAYRHFESKYGKDSLKKVILPVPLANFPLEIDGWLGEDAELSDAVQKVAGNDDFVNRWYHNDLQRKGVGFYIAYAGQPRNMLGHRPQVCYVGAGWILEETVNTEFTTISGQVIPCMIHHFKKPSPDTRTMLVLNYYILNGSPTIKEEEFNSFSFRMPNIDGKIAKYIAQVQVNSTDRSNIMEFAALSADEILKYLPDKDGNVAKDTESKGVTVE